MGRGLRRPPRGVRHVHHYLVIPSNLSGSELAIAWRATSTSVAGDVAGVIEVVVSANAVEAAALVEREDETDLDPE